MMMYSEYDFLDSKYWHSRKKILSDNSLNSDFDDDDGGFWGVNYDSDDSDVPHQKNYTILKKDDIRKLQEDDITRIFSLALSISKDSASMILPYVNGNFNSLTSYEDKMKYSRYLLRYYKRKIKWCPSPGCDCAIEFHHEIEGYNVTCSCSYTFCPNKNYTILKKDDIRKLQEDNITRIFSLALSISKESATMILPYINGNFNNLTSYEDKMKYSGYLLRYYKRKIKWCPSPGRDCAIEFHHENGGYDATCSCLYTFCRNCKRESHRPVDCETASKWIMKNNAESENTKRMMNLKEGEMEKKSLERYTRYYQHWATQESLRQKAVADSKHVKEVHLATFLDRRWELEPLEFVVEAWLQVVKFRRVLKWSYVYGYYLPDEEVVKRQLFEYSQGEAETMLERVHQCADKEFHSYMDNDFFLISDYDLDEFSRKLAGLISKTRYFFKDMVRSLEDRLFDLDTHKETTKGKGPTKGDL